MPEIKSVLPLKIFRLGSSFIAKLIDLLLLSFVFILPIKFTVPAMLPNSGVFPVSVSELIFEPWSSSIFPILALAFLFLTILRTSLQKENQLSFKSLLIPFLWTMLAGTSFLGFIYATCLDFPILESTYLFALSAFSLTIFLKLFTDKHFQAQIINTMIISALLLSFYGLYQYFFGFENTREYVANMMKCNAISLPENMIQRLKDNQVFSTFAISNNFAGYLILILPLSIFTLYNSPFNGSKILKNAIVGILSLSLISALILTASRSAILSLIIAFILICLFILKIKKRLFVVLSLLSVSLIISFFMVFSKGLASIFVRFDYFNTAFILLKQHILTGSGWGSFFHSYPFFKKYMTGEAPNDPHNFLLSMGSQSGILSLLLALAIFAIPLILSFRKLNLMPIKNRVKSLELPLVLGYTAWFIHSLTDTNFQIAGSVIIVIVFSGLILSNSEKKIQHNYKLNLALILFMCLASAIAVLGLGWNRIFGEYYFSKLYSICYKNPLFSEDYKQYQIDEYKTFNYYLLNSVKYMHYSPFPLSAAANYEVKLNNLQLAETYMKQSLILSPDRASFYYDLSAILAKEGKKNEALYCLQKASVLFPYQYNSIYQQVKEQFNHE